MSRHHRAAVRGMLTVAAILTPVTASSAQSGPRNDPAEEKAVLATVQRMFDAMRTKDTVAFREIFEPNARLVGMRTRASGEQVIQQLTWERFGSMMASDTRGQWNERAFT